MAGLSGGALYRILEDANFTVLVGTAVEGAEARLAPVPAGLAPAIREVLTQRWPNGLYAHQAEALIETSSGHDICLATSTASGKSLVFMSAAADALQRDPKRKVLAIYPAPVLSSRIKLRNGKKCWARWDSVRPSLMAESRLTNELED